MSNPPRILIARDRPLRSHSYDVILYWIQREHPLLATIFDVCMLPSPPEDDSLYQALVFWLQDPTEFLEPEIYRHAIELAERIAKLGLPIVNRAERQRNLTKVETARRLRAANINTPQIADFASRDALVESAEQLGFPVVLRENIGHAGEFLLLNSPEEARQAALENYFQPVLSQFVNVQSEDGRHRKFRCFVIGDRVLSNHLQISRTWLTRGLYRISDLATREEEIEYISSPDPQEALMLKVRDALDVEFLGIDYGVDREGKVAIWEANQFPHLHFSTRNLSYRNFAIERTIAAMVLHYLILAGIDPPARLVRQASYEE